MNKKAVSIVIILIIIAGAGVTFGLVQMQNANNAKKAEDSAMMKQAEQASMLKKVEADNAMKADELMKAKAAATTTSTTGDAMTH